MAIGALPIREGAIPTTQTPERMASSIFQMPAEATWSEGQAATKTESTPLTSEKASRGSVFCCACCSKELCGHT
eukprot:6888044-Prymnesium_polylepis.1